MQTSRWACCCKKQKEERLRVFVQRQTSRSRVASLGRSRKPMRLNGFAYFCLCILTGPDFSPDCCTPSLPSPYPPSDPLLDHVCSTSCLGRRRSSVCYCPRRFSSRRIGVAFVCTRGSRTSRYAPSLPSLRCFSIRRTPDAFRYLSPRTQLSSQPSSVSRSDPQEVLAFLVLLAALLLPGPTSMESSRTTLRSTTCETGTSGLL